MNLRVTLSRAGTHAHPRGIGGRVPGTRVMRMHGDDAVATARGDRIGWTIDVVDARRSLLGHIEVLIADRNCRFPRQGIGILGDAVGNRAVPLPFLP